MLEDAQSHLNPIFDHIKMLKTIVYNTDDVGTCRGRVFRMALLYDACNFGSHDNLHGFRDGYPEFGFDRFEYKLSTKKVASVRK